MSETKFDVAAALEAGRLLAAPITLPGGAPIALVPDGFQIEDLQQFAPRPAYVRAKVEAENFKSFSEYFNKFKTTHSTIFASRLKQIVAGVIDYHQSKGEAAHGAHVVRYAAPLSIEWQRWTGIDGKFLDQVAFAQFIEENQLDIREPASADILEIANELTTKRKVDFSSGTRLHDGVQQLSYVETVEETTSKGHIDVPVKFVLGVPIYFGGEQYKVEAFLRYRIADDRKLKFRVDLHRRQYIEQAAFEDLVKQIESLTETAAIYGAIA